MSDLTPDIRLRLNPRVRIGFSSLAEPHAEHEAHRLPLGPHGLVLVEAFRNPASVSETMTELKPRFRGSLEWVATLRLITQLKESGILLPEDSTDEQAPQAAGFDSPSVHVAMLDDLPRTNAFIEAIEKLVQPGDVVAEIGTGSGVLAAAAARAGASKVFAIERKNVADAARQFFNNNGLDDRIEIIRGDSTCIELPESADFIIGEIFGHDALDENALESFLDARRRLLKPGGRFLPRSVTVCAVPVELPDDVLQRRRFTDASLAEWKSAYEFDFSALKAWQTGFDDGFLPKPEDAARFRRLAPPTRLPEIDFARNDSSIVKFEQTIEIIEAGRIDGVLTWFELDLGSDIRLSTDPMKPASGNHWRAPVHLLGSPYEVAAGALVRLRYENGSGARTSATAAPVEADA